MSVESLRLIEAEKPNRFWGLFDMDGVIADIAQSAAIIIQRDLGLDIRRILKAAKGQRSYWLHEWPEIKAFPGGPEFCCDIFKKREVYDLAVPFPGAVKVLNKLHRQGDVLGIDTGRLSTIPEVREASINWLIDHGLGWLWPNINFNPDKNAVVQCWKPDLFADDYGIELRRVSAVGSGFGLIKVHFGNRFYSRQEIDTNSIRVKNWRELDCLIQSIKTARMSHNVDTSEDSV